MFIFFTFTAVKEMAWSCIRTPSVAQDNFRFQMIAITAELSNLETAFPIVYGLFVLRNCRNRHCCWDGFKWKLGSLMLAELLLTVMIKDDIAKIVIKVELASRSRSSKPVVTFIYSYLLSIQQHVMPVASREKIPWQVRLNISHASHEASTEKVRKLFII